MGKEEGKKLTKNKKHTPKKRAQNQREGASPSPSEGGDVRGNSGIEKGEQVLRGSLPKPLQGEGMCLAGYVFPIEG